MRCATPPVNSSVQVPVYVSLNGQQYSPSLPSFDFYEPPRVWSISPASGTMLGGVLVTVTGFSFQRSFRNLCRCGATRLPYPELATPIPSHPHPNLNPGVNQVGRRHDQRHVAQRDRARLPVAAARLRRRGARAQPKRPAGARLPACGHL